jgi:hypothetical protein
MVDTTIAGYVGRRHNRWLLKLATWMHVCEGCSTAAPTRGSHSLIAYDVCCVLRGNSPETKPV